MLFCDPDVRRALAEKLAAEVMAEHPDLPWPDDLVEQIIAYVELKRRRQQQ